MEDDEKGETQEGGGAVASVVALLSWLSFSLSSFTSGFENTFCPAPAPVFNNDPNVNVVDPWPNTLAGDDDARAEKGEGEVAGTAAHGLFCEANAAPNCQHNQKEKKRLCQGPIPICNCTTVMILLQSSHNFLFLGLSFCRCRICLGFNSCFLLSLLPQFPEQRRK